MNFNTVFLKLSVILGLLLIIPGCKKDQEKPDIFYDVEVTVGVPLSTPDAVLTNLSGQITNKENGEITAIVFEKERFTSILKLTDGKYTIALRGTMHFKDEKGIENSVSLSLNSDLEVIGTSIQQTYRFDFIPSSSSFLIEEIFYTGTRTLTGATYDDDKYIRITNNSHQTLYADGLALLISMFSSEEKKHNLTPDILSEAMPISMVMTLPTSVDGRQIPVLPGASLIICQSALDHTKTNPNSFSLENADYEWLSDKGYLESGIFENPKVPNMTLIFATGDNPVWSMNNNGFYSYAIAKLPNDFSSRISEFTYEWTEDLIMEGIQLPGIPGEPCLKIPNEWIIDAVNLSTRSDFQWIPISTALDAGWIGVADEAQDQGRFGKSVLRKREDDKLKDSNNSTEDFVISQQPTLKKDK